MTTALEALTSLVQALPRCQKGCCLAPATRIAPYGDGNGNIVAELHSCDSDGGPTIREFDYAEALRTAAHVLEAQKLEWWDPGSLNPPAAG